MKRTTILIPDQLKKRTEKEAERLNISFSEYIRKSLELMFQPSKDMEMDPLLADKEVFSEKCKKDLSKHHDDYLYEG